MYDTVQRMLIGEALSAADAEAAFDRLMTGDASPVEMAALLTALKVRGESPAEVAGGVRALRKAMIPLDLDTERLVDTCGTGGGTLTTFNISTAASIVAAGAGVRIAKHGNRSFTSKCGSADVLEALGVPIQLDPIDERRMFEEAGFVFMFAPAHHPAMRHVGPVRSGYELQEPVHRVGHQDGGSGQCPVGIPDLTIGEGHLAGSERVRAVGHARRGHAVGYQDHAFHSQATEGVLNHGRVDVHSVDDQRADERGVRQATPRDTGFTVVQRGHGVEQVCDHLRSGFHTF